MTQSILSAIFKVSFFLLFIGGGFLAFVGVPFRPFFVVFLLIFALPLLPNKNIPISFYVFASIILISGYLNGSSSKEVLYFIRFFITPSLVLIFLRTVVGQFNLTRIFRMFLFIGIIQLPVIIFQKLFYDELIVYSAVMIDITDFDFGSFYIANDPATTFYLLCLIVILLFNSKSHQYITLPYFWVGYFAFTILITNARMAHILLALVLLAFFLMKMSLKNILSGAVLLVFIVISLYFSGFLDQLLENFQDLVWRITFDVDEYSSYENFAAGRYSREAAVLYYLNEPLKFFGDGPSKYYDPVTQEYLVGNNGLIFTFYSEIGLLGLGAGYMVIYSIAREFSDKRVAFIPILFSFCMIGLTITTNVLSDMSIIFSFVLFLSINKKILYEN